MARATLEMFLKLTGADKTSRGLDKVSKSTKELDKDVKNSAKNNEQFAAGMSGLGATAIVGAAGLAAKSLLDFSLSAIQAASSAQEAAGAFGTTFGGAAEQLNKQLAENANLFGLTTAEAQQLISVFGSVAQGIGFTQQESADLSSELFNLAGDIASFNNITAGAAPVLQAFRSALVGEREALKTYGIAITEAEVQTKAFEQTGKNSADALTRQEKALATSALIFERATVQIGNAKREEAGFAAQALIARSATQELREELGEELLPAAGEVLNLFNELREDATPALIQRFSDLNLQILGVVSVFEGLRDVLSFGDKETQENLKTQIAFGNGLQRVGAVLKALGIVRKTDIAVEKAQEIQTLNSIKRFENYNSTQQKIINSFKNQRQQVLITTAQTQKYSMHLDKKLNPILGEQNRLIAENVELELDRNKVLNLLSSANDNVEKAEKDRNKALKDVQELTIAENLADAKAAKRKSELQTEIALLTAAEESGKDVTNELAIARAELAEAEFEIANQSDALVRAREILEIAENNLTTALDNQRTAFDKRNDVLLKSLDLTARQIIENGKLADSFAAIDFATIPSLPVGGVTLPTTTEVPSLPVQDFTTTFVGGRQQASTIDFNINMTDAIGEIIQRENIKIQERGNTFVLEG